MPINTFGSNLRVDTNVNGEIVNNDEFQATKSHEEHNSAPQTVRPWATTYVEQLPEPTPEDPALTAVNNRELRNRNLLYINDHQP